MRFLLTMLLVTQFLLAESLTIGAGPYIQTQPYKDVKPLVLPSPVIFYDNGIFYMRWTRVGIYFLGSKKDDFAWGFSLTAQPRPYGYKPSDATSVNNMDERKTTWEGGVCFATSYKDGWFEAMAVTDLLNKHETWIYKAEAGYDFKLGNFSFYPSAIAIYNSADFMDYYYGVKNSETTAQRGFYSPKAAFQFALQTYIKYPINDKFSLLTNLRIDKLPNEARNSPIVNEAEIYSGLFSLIYTFDF